MGLCKEGEYALIKLYLKWVSISKEGIYSAILSEKEDHVKIIQVKLSSYITVDRYSKKSSYLVLRNEQNK